MWHLGEAQVGTGVKPDELDYYRLVCGMLGTLISN